MQKSKSGKLLRINKLRFPQAEQSWYVIENKRAQISSSKAGKCKFFSWLQRHAKSKAELGRAWKALCQNASLERRSMTAVFEDQWLRRSQSAATARQGMAIAMPKKRRPPAQSGQAPTAACRLLTATNQNLPLLWMTVRVVKKSVRNDCGPERPPLESPAQGLCG